MSVCCGGIVGMGESRRERAGLVAQLANLDPHPESVPINELVQVEGTPMAGTDKLDPFEFVRTIAVARITMPASFVRLSAGRQEMNEAMQALCIDFEFRLKLICDTSMSILVQESFKKSFF